MTLSEFVEDCGALVGIVAMVLVAIVCALALVAAAAVVVAIGVLLSPVIAIGYAVFGAVRWWMEP